MKLRYILVCMALGSSGLAAEQESLFFESPQKAVAAVADLLRAKDWKELARYYDLTDSGVARADLESGEFFCRKSPPADADQAGLWRWKHPFPPTFKFHKVEKTDAADVLEVTVVLEIDQGGGPIQKVLNSFLTRKSSAGFQILPPRNENVTPQK